MTTQPTFHPGLSLETLCLRLDSLDTPPGSPPLPSDSVSKPPDQSKAVEPSVPGWLFRWPGAEPLDKPMPTRWRNRTRRDAALYSVRPFFSGLSLASLRPLVRRMWSSKNKTCCTPFAKTCFYHIFADAEMLREKLSHALCSSQAY